MPGKGISKAAIAATLAGAILSMLAVVAFGAAKADAYVYWGDFQNGRIGRAANDGTDVNDSFIAEAGAGPDAVAVDAGHVYWADQTGESIGRANIDGSGVEEQLHHRRRQSNRPGGERVLDLLVDATQGPWGGPRSTGPARTSTSSPGLGPRCPAGSRSTPAMSTGATLTILEPPPTSAGPASTGTTSKRIS